MTENRPARQMTEFGKTLNKLMVNHDVYTWQALRSELERVGYEVGQSRLSQYLYGDRNPQDPQRLFDAISAALGLTRDEEMRLAYSFAYPSGGAGARRGLTEENIERAQAFEEELKARKERKSEEGESSTTRDRRV